MSPNRIHSHPVDHGTGGSTERDDSKKQRFVWSKAVQRDGLLIRGMAEMLSGGNGY